MNVLTTVTESSVSELVKSPFRAQGSGVIQGRVQARTLRYWVFVFCLLFARLEGADLDPLDLAAPGVEWQALFDSMHTVERVAAPFEESRSFSFRKEPKRYRGVFRKAADGRVSLAYTEPEAMVLHIGDGFAYYRKGDGAIRRIPDSNTQEAALGLLPRLFNFDLKPIAEYYNISGRIDDAGWRLAFAAKEDVGEELPYQRMDVQGQGTDVQRIELNKSETQRVLIEMGDPVYPEFYLPEAKAAYFFQPEAE